jgi:hypothetical protein
MEVEMQVRFNIKKFFGFASLALSVISCQEPYNVDDIESSKNIIVFEGAITNDPGPYKVSIYMAKPFGSRSSSMPVGVSNANVTIKDDNGEVERLFESRNGDYFTSPNGIRGTIGRTYRLTVKLRNGNIFESVPTKLVAADTINSLYAEPGTYEVATVNEMGEYNKKTYEGLYVYADISSGSDVTNYYKFNNLVIWQTTRIKDYGTEFSYTIFIRKLVKPDNLPIVKSSVLYNDSQFVKKQKLLFLSYVRDLSEGDTANKLSPYVNAGWVVSTTVSTISKESYKYYDAITTQLSGKSQLFDPIATQVKGNIICRTDSTQLVLGIFEVYTKSQKNMGFYWTPERADVAKEYVSDPGPMKTDTFGRSPAPYWVNFYGNK